MKNTHKNTQLPFAAVILSQLAAVFDKKIFVSVDVRM